MKPLAPLVAAAALLLAAPAAQSAAFHFTGSIDHHNDIVTIPFTLDEDADIFQLWTDSWLDGLNFDPIAALWADDGSLIAEIDDDASIHPATQTYGDAGLSLASLLAGDYLLTLTASPNFAVGNDLTAGFSFDAETPTAISSGTYWSVWFEATQADTGGGDVPEPALPGLLAVGALIAHALRRRAHR